jgi:opacity protein-like surface antigen
MVAQNVSARIEYAYSKFGSDSLPALATDLGVNDARVKYSRNAVTAGLNFRF